MKSNKPFNADYKHWGNVSRAVINGVIGDYLVQQNNPLAIDMGFYHQGSPVSFTDNNIALSNKVVVLLHGLTNLETIWNINTQHMEEADDAANTSLSAIVNYGTHLQRDFGYTPLFLRYNTGLQIESNGQQFAQLMDTLISDYPKAIGEIIFIGFSMGGLLMRYAQKQAIKNNSPWLSKLRNCFYLGTPHEGSYLERFGHLTSSMVRAIPIDYVSHWAEWIDVRSKGIQDLRHGLVDLKNIDNNDEHGVCGSFYNNAQHHFISGSLSKESNSLLNKVLGDSLVTHSSANPESSPKNSKYFHFNGISHMPLAHSKRVYQQIKIWLEEGDSSIALVIYDDEECVHIRKNEVFQLNERETSVNNVIPPNSKKQMVAGALALIGSGFDKMVNTVENIHVSIAKEPHSILKKIPLLKTISGIIETTHISVIKTVYSSVRQGGKLIRISENQLNKN